MDKNFINQLILKTNKKRKNDKKYSKKCIKTAKIVQKTVKTTQIAKRVQKSIRTPMDIFSLAEFYQNKEHIYALSKYLSQKINSQICRFRGVKSITIVETVAKYAIKECFCGDIYNIDKYIIDNYNILYKKEMQILPYLLLNECLTVACNVIRIFHNYYNEIMSGASQNIFEYRRKYSLAKIYGIVKYNQNLLKYIEISNVDVKKCVFAFISKLIWYQRKMHLILKMIDNLQKYTNFRGQKLNLYNH